MVLVLGFVCCFFFKQKTAYEMRISDWSSDVCSSDLRLAEGDQALLAFVPEGEADAAEALQEGEAAGAGELGMVAQHPRQTIVGDATGKVVDVVDADVRCQPAQHARQVIGGAAAQRRLCGRPAGVPGPVGVLEKIGRAQV